MKGICQNLSLLAALLTLPCITGCSIMDTGPAMTRDIMGGVTAIGTTLAARLDPHEMTAGASGSIQNPEFVVDGFVGTGVHWSMTLRMIGADAQFDVDAAGAGSAEHQAEVLDQIAAIWRDAALSDQERQSQVLALLAAWVASVNESVPDGG